MRKLAILTLFLAAPLPALAQQGFNPGFDNQTGHAQNAARMMGFGNSLSQVHQMNTSAANTYSPEDNGRLTTATSPSAATANPAATAPATPGGALPLNPAASGNMSAAGAAAGSGGAPQ